jgi:hypothetical protein
MINKGRRIWVIRVLIAIVTFINLQSAVLFLWKPLLYAPAFELKGEIGAAIVQGMGLLFLMWNVPYVVSMISPVKYLTSLYEAVIMQALGFVGETIVICSLPGQHPVLHATISRFIIFDGIGLMLLLIAAWFARRHTGPSQVE